MTIWNWCYSLVHTHFLHAPLVHRSHILTHLIHTPSRDHTHQQLLNSCIRYTDGTVMGHLNTYHKLPRRTVTSTQAVTYFHVSCHAILPHVNTFVSILPPLMIMIILEIFKDSRAFQTTCQTTTSDVHTPKTK